MFAPPIEASHWRHGLNDRQQTAVLHDGGPLLVIAGAGSGKTRTLAARVARLVEQGADPDRILLLTFTRRAAAEMLRRAGAMIGGRDTGRVWGGTFHGIAHRLLRRHAPAVGLSDGFTVLDQGDAEGLFGIVRADLDVAGNRVRFPRKQTINAVYSRVVNSQTRLTETLNERFPWCVEHADALKRIFREYTDRKRAQNVVDFDDLLLYWRALLHSPVGPALTSRFEHVLVDEYQDTNRVQGEILQLLCRSGCDLTVVGDDAQAIYSFRAASVENILTFPEDHPGATTVTLEQNYRSTPEILSTANAVLASRPGRFPKQLWSERPAGSTPRLVICADPSSEAEYVCDAILDLREQGIDLRDQAVLFRTGHHSDTLEIELSRRNIPFVKFGGLKFLDAAHVKDLLAMLRILDNPTDELAWDRVLRMIPGVGPATARRMVGDITGATPGVGPLTAFVTTGWRVSAEGRAPLTELQSALSDLHGPDQAAFPPAAQIDRLIPFCELVFPTAYPDAGARLMDIATLRELSARHPNRSHFVTELVLDPPTSTTDLAGPPHLDDDYLILSTIHSAKGGEWRAVYLIHAADGNLPSDMALSEPGGLEEELRIMYVALTRAKDHLHVTVPQRYYHHRNPGNAAHSYALPSRFLQAADSTFETSAADPATEDGGARPSAVADPVAPMLDALWD